MEHPDYYEALSERVYFGGITADGLLQVAKYKPGKSFSDFAKAIQPDIHESINGAGALLGGIAHRISEVVEIDASQPLEEYVRRLHQQIKVPANEPARSN